MSVLAWLEPWGGVVNDRARASLLAELMREVTAPHSLAGADCVMLAARGDRDDVLFGLLDGSGRVAVVHT